MIRRLLQTLGWASAALLPISAAALHLGEEDFLAYLAGGIVLVAVIAVIVWRARRLMSAQHDLVDR